MIALALAAVFALIGCTPAPDPLTEAVHAVYAQSQGLTAEQADAHRARDLAIERWAIEWELVEPFDLAALEGEYQASRATGGYGASASSLWEYFRLRVESDAQSIRDALADEQSMDEVEQYYDANPQSFERQDRLVIEVAEWEGTRAIGTSRTTIDETSVRALQEGDDAVIAAALDLEEGEQAVVDRGAGRQALITCLSRVETGLLPFEEVVQAAAFQLAEARFGEQLAQRMGAAE
ncbi:hypothetical protein [Microbacterium sp. GXF6406]